MNFTDFSIFRVKVCTPFDLSTDKAKEGAQKRVKDFTLQHLKSFYPVK